MEENLSDIQKRVFAEFSIAIRKMMENVVQEIAELQEELTKAITERAKNQIQAEMGFSNTHTITSEEELNLLPTIYQKYGELLTKFEKLKHEVEMQRETLKAYKGINQARSKSYVQNASFFVYPFCDRLFTDQQNTVNPELTWQIVTTNPLSYPSENGIYKVLLIDDNQIKEINYVYQIKPNQKMNTNILAWRKNEESNPQS